MYSGYVSSWQWFIDQLASAVHVDASQKNSWLFADSLERGSEEFCQSGEALYITNGLSASTCRSPLLSPLTRVFIPQSITPFFLWYLRWRMTSFWFEYVAFNEWLIQLMLFNAWVSGKARAGLEESRCPSIIISCEACHYTNLFIRICFFANITAKFCQIHFFSWFSVLLLYSY